MERHLYYNDKKKKKEFGWDFQCVKLCAFTRTWNTFK